MMKLLFRFCDSLSVVLREKQVLDTSFSGSVIGESAMNSSSDVGSPLEFVFHVSVALAFFRHSPKIAI